MTYFECYADESLLRFLGHPSNELSGGHSHGRSRVCAKLSKVNGAFGLVDEDPGAARDPYLTYLYTQPALHQDVNLILFEHKKAQNRLLVLRPTLEHFIVNVAAESNLDLESERYRLSMRADRLHDMLSPKYSLREQDCFLKSAKSSKVIETLSSLVKQY